MRISFVIPMHNEEKRIQKTVREIRAFRQNFPWDSEWIFVDDGSTDATEKVAREELGGMPYRWIRFEKNQGKGRAVQRGMLEATGDFVFFTDADLSTPLPEYERLLQPLQNGYDVALGSRALAESRVQVHQNFIRETMGKVFNRIARLFSFKGIWDSQCGFKGFRKDVARELFQEQKIRGFAFDAEIVYLAQKKGYRLAEIPVTWRNSPQSRVRMVKDSLQMFFDVVRIKWLHRN